MHKRNKDLKCKYTGFVRTTQGYNNYINDSWKLRGGMTDYWSRGVTGLITGKVFGGNWERMEIEITTKLRQKCASMQN